MKVLPNRVNLRLVELSQYEIESLLNLGLQKHSFFGENLIFEANSSEIKKLAPEELVPLRFSLSKWAFSDKITFKRLKNWISLCEEANRFYDFQPVDTFICSEAVCGENFKERILDNEDKCHVVYIHKNNCPSCYMMATGFESFACIISEIKDLMSKFDPKIAARLAKQKFHVGNPEKLANVSVSRINMMNEIPEIALPSRAPLVLIIKGKDIEVFDAFKHKINPGDKDKIMKSLFSLVGDSK